LGVYLRKTKRGGKIRDMHESRLFARKDWNGELFDEGVKDKSQINGGKTMRRYLIVGEEIA
jgi:hypothetical protein